MRVIPRPAARSARLAHQQQGFAGVFSVALWLFIPVIAIIAALQLADHKVQPGLALGPGQLAREGDQHTAQPKQESEGAARARHDGQISREGERDTILSGLSTSRQPLTRLTRSCLPTCCTVARDCHLAAVIRCTCWCLPLSRRQLKHGRQPDSTAEAYSR